MSDIDQYELARLVIVHRPVLRLTDRKFEQWLSHRSFRSIRGARLSLCKLPSVVGKFSERWVTGNPNPVVDGYRGLDGPSGIWAGRASRNGALEVRLDYP
jgi:hypothetical protein